MLPPRVLRGRRLWRAALRYYSVFAALCVFVLVGGLLSRSAMVTAQALPPPQDPAFFPATGYRIASPAILNYFLHRGGVRSLGYPISSDFPLQGRRVQLFQRQLLELRPDGSVAPATILSDDVLPVTHMDGLVLPSADPDMVAAAPSPLTSPDYLNEALSFVSAYVPDTWNDLQVNFQTTYLESVSCADAFGTEPCDPSQLAAFALELWGLPTSQPTPDPNNADFVYQRFERGIMHFSRATGLTQGLLVGDWLKRIMVGQNLSPDLDARVLRSPLYNQFAPSRPLGLNRPAELPDTSLAQAFRADTLVAAGALQQQQETPTLPPAVAATATAVAATATAVTATQVALQSTEVALTSTAIAATSTVQAGVPTATVPPSSVVTDIPVTNEGCLGDEQMWFIPRRPNIGTHVEIAVTSRRHHDVRFIRMVGPMDTGSPVERIGPLGFVWTWTVVPAVEAFHQWTFYADGLRPCITSGFNAFAPLGATQTPTETPQPTNTPGATATTTPTPRPPVPSVQSVNPHSGPCGSVMTISGQNFGNSQSEVQGVVQFSGPGGGPAESVLSWNPTQITVSVPSTLIRNTTYTIIVADAGGASSNDPTNPNLGFTAQGSGCTGATPTP